jgi:integrase
MSSPKLLDRVRAAVRVRHYSIRTEEAYVRWVRRFVLFSGKRHPTELGEAEVSAFLSHLAVQENVAASTQNQALNALVFLYRPVLDPPFPDLEAVVRAKKPGRLPTVPTRTEAGRVLEQLEGTAWLVANLLYGSGLRLMEAVRLRVNDLGFEERQITVRDGKGRKDRRTMLPGPLLEPLRAQLSAARRLHEEDLRRGYGTVHLPNALARKTSHPSALYLRRISMTRSSGSASTVPPWP